MFNIAIKALLFLPYNDTQCGAKIFRKKAISKVLPLLTLSQWAFDVDLLYNLKNAGFTIKEHPTVWSDRQYSKINFLKSGPMMFLGVVRLRIINSPFKSIIRVYDLANEMARKMLR